MPTTAAAPEQAEMAIERGQYGAPAVGITTGGSALLDQLTAGARAAYASDVYLSAGSPAFQRIGGELAATVDRSPIDGDALARELGVIAPNEARSAWAERGLAVFTYGDGAGRVRVTLTRDHRGPGATLRLLPAEAPALAELGLDGVADWLRDRGLVVIAGPSGSGKTTTLAALVRTLGEQRRRVVAIEDPIEIVHVSAWISQRAVGEHVPAVSDGVAAAMREGADAIVVGVVQSATDAAAVIEAVAGGHLVLTTLVAPRAGVAVERMLDRLPAEQRDGARALCGDALLGTIGPVVTHSGRSFEVAGGHRRPAV
jgi:twitching motility protein PilT